MKPIDSEFRYDQFDFKLLRRQGMVCIFQKRKYYPHLKATATSHEVVVLQRIPANTFPDWSEYPEREAMPKSEDWGTYGWTPLTLEDAETKFAEWVEREEKSRR